MTFLIDRAAGTAIYAHSCARHILGCSVLLIGLKAELGYWIFIYRGDMARPTNVMHSRTFAIHYVCVRVCIHIFVRIFSARSRYLRRVGSHALRSIMYQPQMRVYHPWATGQ